MLELLTKKGREQRRRRKREEAKKRGYDWALSAFILEGTPIEEIEAYPGWPDDDYIGKAFDEGVVEAIQRLKRHCDDPDAVRRELVESGWRN